MAALDGTVALVTRRRDRLEELAAAIKDDGGTTRDRRVAVNEVLVRAAEQTW